MNIKRNDRHKRAALGNWANRLRAALGASKTCVIPTEGGLATAYAMPTLSEMETALNMSEAEMRRSMARDGLVPWDVAKKYVGADETCAFYR